MSRNKWLIVAGLALANVVVLGTMAIVVVGSLTRPDSAPTPTHTLMPSSTPVPTATMPLTWTPTLSPTPPPSSTPRATKPPTGTPTPWPTPTVTPPPSPAPVLLENPVFEEIRENLVPGWQIGSFANWSAGDAFDPDTSYGAPRFHQADDSLRMINGPTLQIDTVQWVKMRAWVWQSTEANPGSRVVFQVRAAAFVSDVAGGYVLKAGLDPSGGEGCDEARWGVEQIVNQNDGVVVLTSPEVVTGEPGRVTACAFAETQFAQVYHAAFFDDAALSALPPAEP